jgi:hypothetical protein
MFHIPAFMKTRAVNFLSSLVSEPYVISAARVDKWVGFLRAPHVLLSQVDRISSCATSLAVTSGQDLFMRHTSCCHKWVGSRHAPHVLLSQVGRIYPWTTRLAVINEWDVSIHNTSCCHKWMGSLPPLHVLLSQAGGISQCIIVLLS